MNTLNNSDKRNGESEDLERLREIKIHTILDISNNMWYRRQSFRCPFHNEKTPSFVLYPDGSYHCFGCGKNGKNSIDFLIDMGLSFRDAVEELKTYIK